MRAALCLKREGNESLKVTDILSPKIVLGSVRVQVYAAGVNFADALLLKGTYQVQPPLPFAPGLEIAGVVSEVVGENPKFCIGDRVLGLLDYGGFAEEVIVNENELWNIPDAMSFEQAAAFPVVYGTSEIGLNNKLSVGSGETLLVNGASSGVGLAAVKIAKLRGARVIASASSKEKLLIAAQFGADETIKSDDDDFKGRVKRLTGGRGVDAIFDPVGGEVFDRAFKSVRAGGRLLIVGFASGSLSKIPANILLVKNITVIGYYWGAYRTMDKKIIENSFKQLFRWFENGQLAPAISHRFSLDQVNDAINTIVQREAKGKVVLIIKS